MLWFFFLVVINTNIFAQIKLLEKISLSKKVNETSGIIYFNKNLITFNDSGGKPELYFINEKTGKVVKTVHVKNANNIDWESITEDENNIYIGDTGNNKGNRQDLVIYKILKQDLKNNSGNVKAQKIKFYYSNQQSFKSSKHKTNFDCEAIVAYKNKLLLFTKNWGDYKTNIYELSCNKGYHKALKLQTLDIRGMLTSMSFNKEKDFFIGTAYTKKYKSYLVQIIGFNASNQKIKKIPLYNVLGYANQTEALTWKNKHQFYISREASKVKLRGEKYNRKQAMFLMSLID